MDYRSVSEVASWVTPVPGGVGPMTVEMVVKNTLECAKKSLADSQVRTHKLGYGLQALSLRTYSSYMYIIYMYMYAFRITNLRTVYNLTKESQTSTCTCTSIFAYTSTCALEWLGLDIVQAINCQVIMHTEHLKLHTEHCSKATMVNVPIYNAHVVSPLGL